MKLLVAGNEVSERGTPDCSACRPRGIFYGQVYSPSTPIN